MVQYNPLDCLLSAAELPDSDDTPVDNELQNLIPNLQVVWQLNFALLLDPRLLKEVGDLTTTNFSQLMR